MINNKEDDIIFNIAYTAYGLWHGINKLIFEDKDTPDEDIIKLVPTYCIREFHVTNLTNPNINNKKKTPKYKSPKQGYQ